MAKNKVIAWSNEEQINNKFVYYPTMKDIKRIAKEISNEIGEPLEVHLHFVSSEEIKALNNEHRELNKSTDVLSFPHNEKYGKHLNVGDIFINTDIVVEQAESIGSDPITEVKFLFMHGLLHLVGYDHIELKDEKAMCKRQREIFTKLGIRNDLKDTDLV